MKNMKIDLLNVLLLVFLTSCLKAETKDSPSENPPIYSQTKPESQKSDSIQYLLTQVINEEKAPGMIAAIISSEGVIAIASAEERKAGSGIAFTTHDMVHLGSCTKAMTSTLIATLVAEGELNWDTKLIDAIPELKESIHTDYHKITLWQLLTHRAGLNKNPRDWGAHKQKEIKERRLDILKDNLQNPANYKRDEFHYSNFGYMIAACMAEQVTGLSWEILMKNRLFDPLDMSSAGFGAPNTHNQIDQPWGHSKSWFGNKWKPDQSDNPEALGPEGRVHCSIEDWAKFLSLYLTGDNPVLEQKYLKKLIEPVGDHFYAGGWGVAEQTWAKGKMLSHSGSNGIWYCSVVITPDLNRAFIVATNSCDFGVTADLCKEIINKLIISELDLGNN
ncbi:MAG: beta-lactamase family protein [Bacteroidetes bacterium]|nr:beta-lactamase family protein [Bacteroidota bacterium]